MKMSTVSASKGPGAKSGSKKKTIRSVRIEKGDGGYLTHPDYDYGEGIPYEREDAGIHKTYDEADARAREHFGEPPAKGAKKPKGGSMPKSDTAGMAEDNDEDADDSEE